MTYLEVAVATPINNTLTYKAPKASQVPLEPGLRLLVPLGGRQVTGYLLSVVDKPADQKYSIRPVTDVQDAAPLFPRTMVPLFRWLADYYQYPIGEIIKSALPGGLAPQSCRTIDLTVQGKDYFTTEDNNHLIDKKWFLKLLVDEKLSIAATAKIWRTKDKRTLEKWSENGLITINHVLSKDSVRKKTETCVSLSSSPVPPTGKIKKSVTKTLDLLTTLVQQNNRKWIAKRDLTKQYSGARKALVELHEQGLVLIEEKPVYRDPFGEQPPFYPEPPHLTDEQEKALAKLRPAINKGKFAPFLLHGVTGSGKTEVYLKAAAETLLTNRSVLLLVPEIALATQLEGNFLSRFGDKVALLHSGLSSGERFDQWQRILSGEAQIVIGARSAIFAPLLDPGLIIVDEEHDGAYKQEDSFRYQARDVAVLRASQNNSVIILGSATPSIVSYQHATQGKYKLITLSKRVQDRPMPSVTIIDLKKIKTTSGSPPLFSPDLVKSLKDNFIAGNQSLIFLNRRGYANLMLCRDCGNSVQCTNCNISLTLHQHSQELTCHYCGYATSSKIICPTCQSSEIVALGFGTERIEEELSKILPKARIARLDRDTAADRKNYIEILKSVHKRQTDVLIGTQMITKGHHFPHVTLVGVVWADAGLGIPDYKASERTFQLLTQVFGRAGRGEKSGHVLVQTHHPSHFSIQTAQHHNYLDLFHQEIHLRKQLQFPPYSRLANIRLEGKNESHVKKMAMAMAALAKKISKNMAISVLGPAPAPLAKLRGLHRWQLLLKSSDLKNMHRLSATILASKPSDYGVSAVKLSVDVDPENML